MSRWRGRLLALSLGLLLLLALLVLGNCAARAQGYGSGLVMDNVSVPPEVAWRWLPEQRVDSPHGFTVSINGFGLRDSREVAIPKPRGTFRVLCLGDSFTYGIETPEEQTYPHRLEQALRARLPGREVEVWNAGCNGYNSCQEAAWLETYGWQLEPDVVTVGFVMNDVLPLVADAPSQNFPGRSWMLRFPLYHWLRTQIVQRWRLTGDDSQAQALRQLVARHQGKLETSPSENEVTRRYWDEAQACLAKVAAGCRERGLPAALIVFPSLSQMNHPSPPPEPQVVLASLAKREGFVLVDLLTRYAAAGEAALLESDKAHPSALGHSIAADELAAALAAAGALPSR